MLQQAEPTVLKRPRLWCAGSLSYTKGALAILFFWLLMGDFAWNARERAVGPLAQIMLKGGDASDTVVGLLIGSVPAALGMFFAPVIGYRSDRHRSRLGRRIPFLLVSTPVAALAMAGLALAPWMGKGVHVALGRWSPGGPACFIVCFALFWLIFEVAAITGNNLFLALINDVVPAEVLGRFFGLFRLVSLGVGVGFNFWMMGKAEAWMVPMLIGLALIYGIGFGGMCLRVKEGSYPPPEELPAKKGQERGGFCGGIRRYGRECLHHPYYWWLFGVTALAVTAFAPVNTFSLFYAKSVGLELDAYGKALAAGFVISLLVSYPVGILADKMHPLRVAIGALLLYLPLCLWGAFYATTAGTYAFAFVAHVVISGIFFTGTASLGQRLYPKEAFAQFAAAAQVTLGLFTVAVPPVVGFILDKSGRQYKLTFMIGSGLSLLAIGGFIFLLRFFRRMGGDEAYEPPRPNISKA